MTAYSAADLPSPHLHIDDLLLDPNTRTIVCCGSGGVGKTTSAAAMALRAAENGRSVVVLTIDPARRLAQSMGLTELDNTPRAVQGVQGSGTLDAMMLDMKRTFDELVLTHSDPERAQAVLDNPFYQSLSSSFAGTQEYMAMEKLGQLRKQADESGQWDLIVVDTPPSRSALDFLDAPNRLGSFLDGKFIKVLSAPAKGAGKGVGKVFGAGVGLVLRSLNKVLGTQLLADVSSFVQALDGIFGGFRQRAEETYAQLQAPGTYFTVVAAPESDAVREASYFVDRLTDENMPLAGAILNRATVLPDGSLSASAARAAAEELTEAGEYPEVAALLTIHADIATLARRQGRIAARFAGAHPDVPVAVVPALAEDVHDLAGLRQVGNLLNS